MEDNGASALPSLEFTTAKSTDSVSTQNTWTTINTEFQARNIIIGSVGILVNTLAFFIVFNYKLVKPGRKLLLLNLIIADVMLMLSVLIYGLDKTSRVSEGAGCVPTTMLLILTILVSYVICLQLSFLNFLALYKPFKYRYFVTWRHAGIMASAAWIFCAAVCVCCIGFRFRPGYTCAPVVVIPRLGLIGLSITACFSFAGIIILNLAVVIRMKKQTAIGGVSGTSSMHRDERTRERNGNAFSSNPPIVLSKSITERVLVKFKRTKVHPTATISTMASSSKPYSTETKPTHCSLQVPAVDANQRECAPGPSQLQNSFQARSIVDGQPSDGRLDWKLGNPPASNTVQISRTTSRDDKIRKTLLILTTGSSILGSVLFVYLLLIIIGVPDDLNRMVASPWGIIASSSPMIRACINPFFYVMRFIDWHRVIAAFKR